MVFPEGSLQCFGQSSSRLVAAVTFMRLLAAESTVAFAEDSSAASSTPAMSSEQDFGGGAMAVTLTLRLLMHGKVRDVKASPHLGQHINAHRQMFHQRSSLIGCLLYVCVGVSVCLH